MTSAATSASQPPSRKPPPPCSCPASGSHMSFPRPQPNRSASAASSFTSSRAPRARQPIPTNEQLHECLPLLAKSHVDGSSWDEVGGGVKARERGA
eukprot:15023695-Alexandrium_andersonii.AAC.1